MSFMDSTLLHSKRSQRRIINEGTRSHSLIESCTSIHVYRLKWPSSAAKLNLRTIRTRVSNFNRVFVRYLDLVFVNFR